MSHLRFASLPLLGALLLAAGSCSGKSPITPPVQVARPSAQATAGVTFRVTAPASTPAGDTVFVAGDFQGWNPRDPAYALTKQPDGRWTITLALPAGTPIQFKFTRGGWDRVEKGPNGEELSNRTLTPDGVSTYDFTVARWADISGTPGTIVGHVESFSYAPFLGGRKIWVYLPPDYASTTRHYPVLYMHDGQNLFDVRTSFAGEWQVDEACEQLIASGEIRPVIVIGIENGGASRLTEYTPWPASGYGGGGGDAYLTAIRDLLKPEVDRRYRTLVGESNTFMAGSSLGGLISAYAGYHYSETFRRVACVSPSLWWDNRHMIADATARGRPDVVRWYQDMGTIEEGTTRDANGNGIDDYIEDLRAMRDVLVGQGLVIDVDLKSIEAAGHRHNESYWAQRVPGMLRFLVGAPNTTSVP